MSYSMKKALRERKWPLPHRASEPERAGQVGSQASHEPRCEAQHFICFWKSQESEPTVLHFWDDIFIHLFLCHPAEGKNSLKNRALLWGAKSLQPVPANTKRLCLLLFFNSPLWYSGQRIRRLRNYSLPCLNCLQIPPNPESMCVWKPGAESWDDETARRFMSVLIRDIYPGLPWLKSLVLPIPQIPFEWSPLGRLSEPHHQPLSLPPSLNYYQLGIILSDFFP